MKTVPDVKKIAAKSFFGSIPFGKVEGMVRVTLLKRVTLSVVIILLRGVLYARN